MDQLIYMLGGMGPTMSYAFSDLSNKNNMMRRNKTWMLDTSFLEPKPANEYSVTLQQMIDTEIEVKVVELSSKNNKRVLGGKRYKASTWQKSYQSTGFCLVRMWWVSKFMTGILDNLLHHEELSLVEASTQAYSRNMEKHHTWIVVKGVQVALMAAGTKQDLMAAW